MNAINKYIIHLADNSLILGQRLAEWCGHGPILEQDMALTNISLDLIGQARLYYQYAAQIDDNKSITEDDYAYFRNPDQFLNLLITEQLNGDFGKTIIRQLFYSIFNYHQLNKLSQSADEQLKAIALKSIKEVKYHVRFSREWTVRLGDGTEESNRRMQSAIDELWMLTDEMFLMAEYETELLDQNISIDNSKIKTLWTNDIEGIFTEANLKKPDLKWHQSGGKQGKHSEHLSYLLTEMQVIQRTYPNQTW